LYFKGIFHIKLKVDFFIGISFKIREFFCKIFKRKVKKRKEKKRKKKDRNKRRE